MFEKINNEVTISSLTINNHFYINLKGITMLDLQAALAQIETIALGTKAEVQAELDALAASLAENAATIAANSADDAVVKVALANQETIIQALLDKLATAPV